MQSRTQSLKLVLVAIYSVRCAGEVDLSIETRKLAIVAAAWIESLAGWKLVGLKYCQIASLCGSETRPRRPLLATASSEQPGPLPDYATAGSVAFDQVSRPRKGILPAPSPRRGGLGRGDVRQLSIHRRCFTPP